MKTRIQKIMMIAAALIFVGSGVSFASDWNDRDHKPPGNAYGNYQVKKVSPGRIKKNLKPNAPITKRYVVYSDVPAHRYYNDHRWRPAPRRTVVYKPAKKNPIVVFKVILKDLLK
jgi:hypothetical protein